MIFNQTNKNQNVFKSQWKNALHFTITSLGEGRLTFLLILDYSSICAYRGVPHTPTLRIPLKLQPKPRVLGFFDFTSRQIR